MSTREDVRGLRGDVRELRQLFDAFATRMDTRMDALAGRMDTLIDTIAELRRDFASHIHDNGGPPS